MPDLEYLEYDEESGDDLFGSDTELPPAFAVPDTRIPIVPGGSGSATAASGSAGASAGGSASIKPLDSPPRPKPIATPAAPQASSSKNETPDARITPDQRMVQLRRQRPTIPPPPAFGVPSLKNYCSMVIRSNAMRIYDIGGLEYNLLDEFLSQCPREQLHEIEENSPHIKKDTDWLWEYFVIDEYPLFYESCRLRKGQPRMSGWRRMYEKGAQDAEERRTQAMERVANRYRQLEADRQSKRIVVLDTLVAPKASASKWGRTSGAHSLTTARRGASAAAPYSQQNKMQNAISKARSDSQRARVALTHASGKYVPPPPSSSSSRRRPGDEGDLYSNPYNASASGSGSGSIPGLTVEPRLPAPRIPRPKNLLPSAYPTPDSPPARAAERRKPAAPYAPPAPYSTAPATEARGDKGERFRIDPARPREMHAIHKPKVENFATRKHLDFFSVASPMSAASASSSAASPRKRVPSSTVAGQEAKRPRTQPTSRGGSPDSVPPTAPEGSQDKPQHPPSTSASRNGASAPASQPPSRAHTPGTPGTPAPGTPGAGARPPPQPRSNKELESVLFVKKRKPPPSKLFPNRYGSAPSTPSAPARR